MATRPDSQLGQALLVMRTVETATTVAVGYIVKDGNADGECQKAAADELGFGVVIAIGGNKSVTAGAAGDKVTIALLAGAVIIPVLVGTGAATRGKLAKCVTDGVTDAAPTVTTPVATYVHGIFMQSGVAGDFVGLMPCPSWVTE